MVRFSLVALTSLGFFSIACGGESALDGPNESDSGLKGCGATSVSRTVTTGIAEPVPVPESQCGAVVTQEAEGGAAHVDECTAIVYATNPPSSGNHYGEWASFEVYERSVARGFWVHSLEHGGIAFLHSCNDCAEEIEAARLLIDELPEDPTCVGTGAARRVLMTRDPLLDVPWAAASWGYTLRSNCFEPEVFRAFATEHYNQAREDLCYPGRSF